MLPAAKLVSYVKIQSHNSNMKDLSIRTKLIFLIGGLTCLTLSVVLFIVSNNLRKEIRRNVIQDFQEKQQFFKKQQALIYDRLIESCLLIGENSVFKANVDLQDPNTVMEAIDEFSNFTKTDLMIVTNRVGNILGLLGDSAEIGTSIWEYEGIQNALKGNDPDSDMEWPLLWEINNQLYQVVSVPIIAGESILGTITLGMEFTSFEASDLKGESDIEISMFLNDQLLNTTIPENKLANRDSELITLVKNKKNIIDRALIETNSSSTFEINLGGEEAFAYVSPLGTGAHAFYLANVWKKNEMQSLQKLYYDILAIGLVSLFFTILLAYFFSKRISKPILDIVQGMDEVRKGNLQITLEDQGNNEIGKLATSFNEMIVGLKERMFLKKYVGDHTFDMIQGEKGEMTLSKGERKVVTVLFSDIRGFTKYTEEKDPQDVINLLNEYLGFQAELVKQHGGNVDKYVGDELVAFFTGESAIKNAMSCAVAIQEKCFQLTQENVNAVNVGIGINSGEVIIGNIGNATRMDYTVIGAAVNLGSRLCSMAKEGEILFREDLSKNLSYDRVEEIKLKGIKKPLRIAIWKIFPRKKSTV